MNLFGAVMFSGWNGGGAVKFFRPVDSSFSCGGGRDFLGAFIVSGIDANFFPQNADNFLTYGEITNLTLKFPL